MADIPTTLVRIEKKTASANNAVAIVPSDTDKYTNGTRAIYIGGDGDLVVDMFDSVNSPIAVTYAGLTAGTLIPLNVLRVKTTSTTTLMLALW